ncbi:MAG: hypothetical protein ACKOWE_04560 [Micrococcales bacterium]
MNEKPKIEYWFNLKTLKVEKGLQSAAPYRVGPFATEAEALNALKLLQSRADKWREEEDRD